MIFQSKFQKGFTLVEILVYIAVLILVAGVIYNFLVWSITTNTKTKVMREALDNSRRAMEIMTAEIKKAKSVYTPATNSIQLSLETTNYLPSGEITSYADFYLCGTQLCLKREFQEPIALTSDEVEISNLVFTQVNSSSTFPSILVDLKVDYKNPNNRSEYEATVNLTSVASLRSY